MKKYVFLLFTLLCVLFSAPLFAQVQPRYASTRYALVIGNSSYEQSALKNPVNDARLVAKQLEECGFTVTLKTDLKLDGFKSAVASYAESVNNEADAVSLFYYSGHGIQADGVNYLLPIDNAKITSDAALKLYGFSLDTILSLIKAPTQILVMDACRNNPFIETGTRSGSMSRGLSVIGARKNTSLSYLFATQAGETAEDGTGSNSLFTLTLVDEMKKPNTELTAAFNNVTNRVKEQTNGKQIPLNSGTGTNFYFIDPAAAAAALAQAEAELERIKQQAQTAAAKADRNPAEADAAQTARILAEQKIALLQQRKKQADEDAERQKEDERLASLRTDAQNKRIAQIAAETQKVLLSMRQTQSSSSGAEEWVNQIEENKQIFVHMRSEVQKSIDTYEHDPSSEVIKSIEAVKNKPFRKAETESDGSPTADAKRRRHIEIGAAEKNAAQLTASFAENAWKGIKNEEDRLLCIIKNDIDAMNGQEFQSSSLNGSSVVVRLYDYSGGKQAWPLNITLSLLGKPSVLVINEQITYADITGIQTPVEQLTGAQYDEYLDNVEIYDSLFRGAVPVILAEIDYKTEHTDEVSTYQFTPIECRIIRSDENKVIKRIDLRKSASIEKIMRYPQSDIRPLEVIAAEKAAAEKLAAEKLAAAKKALEDRGFVYVEGGTFQMGSTTGDSAEKPVHAVTLSSFYIYKYEVTQSEYQAVIGLNPSNFKSEPARGEEQTRRPVEMVSWYDVLVYCNKLSIKEGLTPCYTIKGSTDPSEWGRVTSSYRSDEWDAAVCDWNANGYRLPTEAEWEYAARGGNKSRGYTYSGSNTHDDAGWNKFNSSKTHEVGKKAANELGIYDMSGNVDEWCWDWYRDYSSSAQKTPESASSGTYRVRRGGSWTHNAECSTVSYRGRDVPWLMYYYYYIGIRVVRKLP